MAKKLKFTQEDFLRFIQSAPNDDRDDWYCTTKEIYQEVYEKFIKHLLEVKQGNRKHS